MEPSAEQAAQQNELCELLLDGARYGDLEDVQHALDNKSDPSSSDEQGRTGLHMASANGHLDVVRLLIDAGAVVRFLLQHGASASALNSHSRTPVDEVLGRPFQDAMMDVINSFSKVPVHVTSFQEGSDEPEGEAMEVEEAPHADDAKHSSEE